MTFDADGQHDEADIPALVDPILAGECEVTLGSRFLGRAEDIPLGRKTLLRMGVILTRLIWGIRITDIHNGLRAFSRKAAGSLRLKMDREAHASEILEQIRVSGLPFREIGVKVYYTNYSLRKKQRNMNAIKVGFNFFVQRMFR